jgi:hypothetical protein
MAQTWAKRLWARLRHSRRNEALEHLESQLRDRGEIDPLKVMTTLIALRKLGEEHGREEARRRDGRKGGDKG